jgi:uncharacterized membrane protein
MITVKTGISAASTAALLALAALQAAPATAGDNPAEAKNVHCYGVNACKGASDCKTAENACKGQNACKGHGIKEMAADECTKAGGTTEPKKS